MSLPSIRARFEWWMISKISPACWPPLPLGLAASLRLRLRALSLDPGAFRPACHAAHPLSHFIWLCRPGPPGEFISHRAGRACRYLRPARLLGPLIGPLRVRLAWRAKFAVQPLPILILRAVGLSGATFGTMTASTPSFSLASILSPSASAGSRKLRLNEPN